MQHFTGKIAVITGAGSGMGRELARQLTAEGCHIAMCDVLTENMEETKQLCEQEAPQGVVMSTFEADVSEETQMMAFRDAVQDAHQTEHINLLFNNAGIGGGGSFINDDRTEWDKTFSVCWHGVYYGTRAFMPMLLKSDEGHIINTSSVNGFWASLGPRRPHTAYSAAKFAVKGFSEALIADLRMHAPHVKVSVVMPGHIGTSIAMNTGKIHGRPDVMSMSADELEQLRDRLVQQGFPAGDYPAEKLRAAVHQRLIDFRDKAPVSAAQAAQIILEGVRREQWRILVGEDAHVLDRLVRENPEMAYEMSFIEQLRQEAGWRI